jgi:GTP-binding protein
MHDWEKGKMVLPTILSVLALFGGIVTQSGNAFTPLVGSNNCVQSTRLARPTTRSWRLLFHPSSNDGRRLQRQHHHLHLQTAEVVPSLSDSPSDGSSSSTRLTRPERKALERNKKQSKEAAQVIAAQQKTIKPMSDECTVHDILRRLQRRHPMEDLGFMERRLKHLLPVQDHDDDDDTIPTTNSTAWAQLAIAGLYQGTTALVDRCLAQHEHALKKEIQAQAAAAAAAAVTAATAMLGTTAAVTTAPLFFIDPQQSSPIPLIRALMSQNRTDDAWHLWEQLVAFGKQHQQQQEHQTTTLITLDLSNAALSTLATYHFRRGEPVAALRALTLMGKGMRPVESERWTRLAQAAAVCQSQLRLTMIQSSNNNRNNNNGNNNPSAVANIVGSVAVENPSVPLPPNVVHSVLMARFRTDPSYLFEADPTWYEIVQNALVRRVVFVTGAVTMAGCPPRDEKRGEAVFIGRSNVGKSSLINLLTNRKSLAYTSKRPGKTQQFNYFTVNDKPRLEKEIKYGDDVSGRPDRDHFYIVDVPGFGYAAVPGAVRDGWKDLWWQYCADRPSVIFHLMDGRHGPTADDVTMSQMIQQTSSAKYVVVLTKVDKNGKFQVSDSVQRAVREAIPDGTPVVWTSAERRWGFDVLWKYLQTAIKTT